MEIGVKEYLEKLEALCETINERSNKGNVFSGVYGVPNDGIAPALYIHAKCSLPLLSYPIDNCLVVCTLFTNTGLRERYKGFDFVSMFDIREKDIKEPCSLWYESGQKDVRDNVLGLLNFIGEDVDRDGIVETPDNVVSLLDSMIGYEAKMLPKVQTFRLSSECTTRVSPVHFEGEFNTLCECHLMPIVGKYHFIVIPNEKGCLVNDVGINSIVSYYSKRLTNLPDMSGQIIAYIVECLTSKGNKPNGIGLVLEGKVHCNVMKGGTIPMMKRTAVCFGDVTKDDLPQHNLFK